jgi:hypothetical protein
MLTTEAMIADFPEEKGQGGGGGMGMGNVSLGSTNLSLLNVGKSKGLVNRRGLFQFCY